MDKWLDAYSKWPPVNQLLFSSVFVAAIVLILFLFGLWVIQLFRYVSIARHGWPGEGEPKAKSKAPDPIDMATIRALLDEVRRHPPSDAANGQRSMPDGLPSVGREEYPWCGTCHPTQQRSSNALPPTGRDWKEEDNRLREQARMIEEQAKIQEEMKLQEEMEQAQEKSKNPCTQGPTGGHKNKEAEDASGQ